MKLHDLGEEEIVARITRKLPLGPQVRLGAGDDCAVLGGKRDAIWRLLKTDAVVEAVHFAPGEQMRRVGWKALCRNISDIAAMGGTPLEALVTIAIPPDRDFQLMTDFYAGLKKAARRFGVSIVGGDTCASRDLIYISVAMTGEVERKRCVLRSGGQPGDGLYVTGRLGGSRAGKHLDFTPRLAEARWLSQRFRLHAMMDLSDGLGTDLPRLARASRCGYELWADEIPCTRGCDLDAALNDGEDFELLFAIRPQDEGALFLEWRKHFPKTPVTLVGRLQEGRTEAFSLLHGYDHFA